MELPVTILKSIFRACRIQMRKDINSFDAGPSPDEDDRAFFQQQDELVDGYWDRVNGGWLDPVKVKKARKEELGWILKQEVFSKIPMSEVDGRLLDLRWIDTIKADGRYR